MTMRLQTLAAQLWNDQSGFILTAELVLISTILVLGLIVGLTSIQTALVAELNDVGDAIGSLNQSYSYNGMFSRKSQQNCGFKSYTAGSAYRDLQDECDAGLIGPSLNCADCAPLPEGEATPAKRPKKSKKAKAQSLPAPDASANIPALST